MSTLIPTYAVDQANCRIDSEPVMVVDTDMYYLLMNRYMVLQVMRTITCDLSEKFRLVTQKRWYRFLTERFTDTNAEATQSSLHQVTRGAWVNIVRELRPDHPYTDLETMTPADLYRKVATAFEFHFENFDVLQRKAQAMSQLHQNPEPQLHQHSSDWLKYLIATVEDAGSHNLYLCHVMSATLDHPLWFGAEQGYPVCKPRPDRGWATIAQICGLVDRTKKALFELRTVEGEVYWFANNQERLEALHRILQGNPKL